MAGALVWDILWGDPPNRFHPVCLIGREVNFLWKRGLSLAEGRKNREKFLFSWGIFLVVMTLILPLGLTGGINFLPFVAKLILSVPLLKGAFSLRGLFTAGREIQEALGRGDLEEARRLTGWHLVSRDTSNLSENDVTGCVIESVAENLNDSFISPIYWFLLAGLPGAWFSRTVNTCDSLIAYRKGDYEWGGKAAARLDDAVQWLPARLTALFICLAAATYRRTSGREAWKVLRSDRKKTESPNAGWTMAAAAGALGVRLEKKGHYLLNRGKRECSLDDLEPLFVLTKRAATWGLFLPGLLLGGLLWLI